MIKIRNQIPSEGGEKKPQTQQFDASLFYSGTEEKKKSDRATKTNLKEGGEESHEPSNSTRICFEVAPASNSQLVSMWV